MAKNYSGRDFLLYALGSAPSAASEATEYTLVGLVRSLSVNQSRNAIDTSTKDDGDDSSFIAGRRNVTLSAGGVFDHTEDGGFTILKTSLAAANGKVWFLVTSTATGDTEFYGSGIVTGLNLDFPDEDVSTFAADIQVTGALSAATGTST